MSEDGMKLQAEMVRPVTGKGAGTFKIVVEKNSLIVGADGNLIESLGIETLGGVFTPIIPAGEKVPCRKQEIFSTAADNQEQIEIALYRGNNEMVKDNHFLGKFQIVGIQPEAKGIPQIEVSFEVSGNAITLSVQDLKGENNIGLKPIESGEETVVTEETRQSGITEQPPRKKPSSLGEAAGVGAFGGALAGLAAHFLADGKLTFPIFIVAYILILGGLKGWGKFVGLVVFTIVAGLVLALFR